MTTDIQRALDKQARLEAEAPNTPWSARGNLIYAWTGTPVSAFASGDTPGTAYLIAHLRNQAKLARVVIETAQKYREGWRTKDEAITDARNNRQREIAAALDAWADHVNGDVP